MHSFCFLILQSVLHVKNALKFWFFSPLFYFIFSKTTLLRPLKQLNKEEQGGD